MKNVLVAFIVFFLLASAAVSAQGREGTMNIIVTIGGTEYAAQFDDSAAAREVASFFPLSLNMKEWAANKEYYARLAKTINSTAPAATAIVAGDIMLYSGRSLVIFYSDSANTSGYIRLGSITGAKNLKEALDKADGKVLFARAKSAATGVPTVTQEEVEINALYKEMYRAMIAKDMDTMTKIHGAGFVLTHMTGTKMNKSEYLVAVKDGTLNYYSADHDDIKVTVNGNRADICGKSKVNAAVYGGGRHTWRLRQDMTLEKQNGAWVFTSAKASTY